MLSANKFSNFFFVKFARNDFIAYIVAGFYVFDNGFVKPIRRLMVFSKYIDESKVKRCAWNTNSANEAKTSKKIRDIRPIRAKKFATLRKRSHKAYAVLHRNRSGI